LFGLVTFILLGVFTYKEDGLKLWANLAMMVFLILQLIPLGILLYWQRTSYLDPKMRILMICIPILFVFGCGVALFYVFGTGYPGQDCFTAAKVTDGSQQIVGSALNLFRLKDNKCMSPQPTCFGTPNSCLGWGENLLTRCGFYNETLLTCTF